MIVQTSDEKWLPLFERVKRHLNITWSDDDTDSKVIDKMADAEQSLNYLLGAECDFFSPGMERQLFLNYMLYSWNDCLNEFENAYCSEILKIRHKYEVKGAGKADEK